jgi:hypothetical protein
VFPVLGGLYATARVHRGAWWSHALDMIVVDRVIQDWWLPVIIGVVAALAFRGKNARAGGNTLLNECGAQLIYTNVIAP